MQPEVNNMVKLEDLQKTVNFLDQSRKENKGSKTIPEQHLNVIAGALVMTEKVQEQSNFGAPTIEERRELVKHIWIQKSADSKALSLAARLLEYVIKNYDELGGTEALLAKEKAMKK